MHRAIATLPRPIMGVIESTRCDKGGLTMVATETRPRCDQTAAWSALQKHFASTGRRMDLREAFRSDAGRFQVLSQQAPHVFADLSKNLLDDQTQGLLLQLAYECELEHHRDAMFSGEP